jgi:HD-like signal output (HDOD) protein
MVIVPPNNPAQSLFGKIQDLPSLPHLYYMLNKEVNDSNSSIVQIGEIISADQALTARLLRISNSAVFGFARKIDTITEAVSLIGLAQVRDLSLCTMVIELFNHISSDLLDVKAFWKHSLGCGISARVLAAYRRMPNIERFFVNGLMHDLGRLLMLITVPDQMRIVFQRARERREMVFVIERELFGYDHAEAGAVLMQKWNLPELAIESTYRHHRPNLSTQFAEEVALVHVADIISHAMELGNNGEQLAPPLNVEAWKKLGFKPTVMASMMKDIDRQCLEVNRIMLKN